MFWVPHSVSGSLGLGERKTKLVGDRLNANGTPLAQLANQVARGDISGAVALVPPNEQVAFLNIAARSYADALGAVLVVLAAICFVAAALVLLLVKQRPSSTHPAIEMSVMQDNNDG